MLQYIKYCRFTQIPGVETLSKRTVSAVFLGNLPKALQKLYFSTKFQHKEIRWNSINLRRFIQRRF